MFKTFFRNIPSRSFSSYTKFFHKASITKEYPNVINNEILSDLEKTYKIQLSPFPIETAQEEKINTNQELLKQFPNRIVKEQMDKLLTKSATIRKYSSVY